MERVKANLERAAAELEVPAQNVYFLNQVHGVAHQVLDGSEDREEMLYIDGDITVSVAGNVACGVRMADCAAILIADRRSGAVAAVHSGWRGTVQGAATAGVAALRELVGEGDLIAAVSPHIEQCCFEVGPEVAEEISAASGLGEAIVDRSREKPHIDLRQVIARQLERVGVAVEQVRGCTMCEPERFHSYRREGKRSGRMLAAIVTRS